MKTCYLISGHPQTYTECVSSFSGNFSSQEVDTYAHLWWDNSHLGTCYKLHFKDTLESIDLSEKIIKDFNLKESIIDSGADFDLTFFKKFTKDAWGDNTDEFYKILTPIVLYGILSQTYSANQAYSLCKKYEYDVVIKARPDLILTKNIMEIVGSLDLSDGQIYFQSSVEGGHLYAGEYPNKPCDWFFVANQKTMGKFLNEWHNSIPEKFSHGIMHTNELIKNITESNNMTSHLIDFGAYIYKNATEHYYKYHNKVEVYLNDFDLESYEPKTASLWPYWVDKINFKHFKNITF